MRRTPYLVVVAALTLVVGATAAFAKSSATTTTTPPTYAAALQARLAKEWKDPKLAQEIVAGLGADTLASFEAKVPLAQVATSPLFTYRPKPISDKAVDSIIAYSFGNRVAADGTTTPGPTNEQLAKAVFKYVLHHKVAVYAQHEIADFLIGVPNLHRIDETVGPDGKVVYLSTAGVAEAARAQAAADGDELGTVGVVCFADHLGRCILTTEKALGTTDVGVPKGITLPAVYDTQSGQSWTRDRATYLKTDLLGRLATL